MSSNSTTMISNYGEQSDASIELHRKKRRKIDGGEDTSSAGVERRRLTNADQIRWRTTAEQRTYAAKLVDALRQVRRRNAQPSSGSRAVRDAADKALAIAARGRTQWSRAILTNRRRLIHHRKARISSKTRGIPPPRTPPLTSATAAKAPPLEKRVKLLGRLVPGCRKLSFPNLLEETTDYIAALQMQVRAMAALAELLSGSTSSTEPVEPVSGHNIENDDDNPVH